MENDRNQRPDPLFPLTYFTEWPSLRSATGRVDIHSLAAFWVSESKVDGPYLEFGVASGRSAICALRASKFYGEISPKEFFLFDSFQGLPELKGLDKESNQFSQGQFSFGVAQVVDNLEKHRVFDADSIHFVEGFFEDSLKDFRLEDFGYDKAAIIHIDVDLYESCKSVLEFIERYLQVGTIILFDDWNCFGASNTRGERRAVREWLTANPHIELNEYASYGWHGKAFIVDLLEQL